MSFALFKTVYQWENNNTETAFDLQANDRAQVVIDNLNDHVDLLSSVVAFYQASEKVTQKEFRAFTENLLKLHSDILSFSWIPRILDSERPGFEEAIHLEGYPDFQITELKDGKLTREPNRKEYFPIYYAEPFEENKITIGFDVYSDPIRAIAIENARDTGMAAATDKIKLLREISGDFSCRIALPFYKKNAPIVTIEERRDNLVGFASLLFRIGKTVDSALSHLGGAGVDLCIYSGSIDDPDNLLYSYYSETYIYKIRDNSKKSFLSSHQEIKFVKKFKMADKNWYIICRPTEAFFRTYAHISSWAILLCGIIIALVFAAYVFSILNRAQHVELLVKERTAALNNLTDEIIKMSRHNELILASIGEGVIGLDVNGNHIFVNPAAVKMLGFAISELIGKPIHVWYHLKEENIGHPSQEYPILIAIKDGQVHTVRNEVFYRKDGTSFYASYISTPVIVEDKIVGMVVSFIDVTEQRIADEKIKAAAREWERTFDAISDLVFIQDKNNVILKVNKACAEALKVASQDIIGKKCYEMLHGLNQPFPGCPFQKTKKDNKAYTEEIFDKNIGIPLLVTTSPIFNDEGEMIGSVHIAKDITQMKEVERKMREALELESGFISTVSHELRTPLSAMKEAINLVSDGSTGPVSQEQQEFLTIAKRNVDRLTRLINDVLDFKKIGSGKMVFDTQENNINEVVEEIKDTMVSLAQNKGLDITFELDKAITKFKFDRDKITQVLANIINNAIRFTEKGSITITTKKELNSILVAVKDTGPGIKGEDMPKLFQKFSQLEKGISRKTGGTGLGLVISREIIERHGGKIWVESQFSKGSTFYFTLPVA